MMRLPRRLLTVVLLWPSRAGGDRRYPASDGTQRGPFDLCEGVPATAWQSCPC